MRLKKWRNTRTNAVFVFVNDYLDRDGVAITDDGQDHWRIGVPPNSRPLTAAQEEEIQGEVVELTGVTPEDGFKALCKEVDW